MMIMSLGSHRTLLSCSQTLVGTTTRSVPSPPSFEVVLMRRVGCDGVLWARGQVHDSGWTHCDALHRRWVRSSMGESTRLYRRRHWICQSLSSTRKTRYSSTFVQFATLFGRQTSNKNDVVQNTNWEFTGKRNDQSVPFHHASDSVLTRLDRIDINFKDAVRASPFIVSRA
jgi:hypothetical protein